MTPDGWSPKDVMFHVGAWWPKPRDSWSGCGSGTVREHVIDVEERRTAHGSSSRGTLDVPTVTAELHAARTKLRQEWCELAEHGELTVTPSSGSRNQDTLHYARPPPGAPRVAGPH